jgi:aminopeptidase N
MLAASPALTLLQTYMQRAVQRVYDEVGWTGSEADSHLTRLLRVQVVDVACVYNHAECLQQAALQFPHLFDNSSQVDVNLRSVAYCHGIALGGVVEWRRAFERYRQSNLATEQSMILSALGCPRDAFLLTEYLHLALAEVELRRQDFATVVVAVARNRNGQQLAWDFVRHNWDIISQRFTTFSLANIVTGVTESFSTPTQLQELREFIAAQQGSLGAAERAAQQAVEATEANVAWRGANELDVTVWLQQQQ